MLIFTFHWWGVVQVVEARVFLVGLESCPICRSPSRAPLSPPLVLSPAHPPRPIERRARLTGQPTEAAGRRERREEERGRGDEARDDQLFVRKRIPWVTPILRGGRGTGL